MIKTYLTTLLTIILCVTGVSAQTVYSDPTPLQLSSKDVKIYFNATGTPLSGLTASDKIYAHTGYNSGWSGSPSWGDNSAKYELTYVGKDLWMLYIGNIASYYSVPAGIEVNVLNFVFRNAGSNRQTSDLSLPVYAEGLQLNLTTNLSGTLVQPYTYVKFTLNTTTSAELSLSVNGTIIAQKNGVVSLEAEYGFEKAGVYQVEATAKAGSETVSEVLVLHCLKESSQVNYPGGVPVMGAVANQDGSVTFCFGAPLKQQVVLVGSWNDFAYINEQVMNYQETEAGKYFWTTVNGLDPDKMYVYYYIIDGGQYVVGDPYARLVLDPYNDKDLITGVFPNLPDYPYEALDSPTVPVAVYYGNINEYNWQVENFNIPDKSNLIIYELLFRDFTGTEGQALGNGTVQKALEKLPYLKELGVNAIELLPIMEFNGNQSWGYNPNFYFAIDKAYGTPDDYKAFIDACHQNGMAVILDMVFNQSDGMHPWYQMYNRNENPFYNFSFEGENGAPHAYSVLNDWNQGNSMVQQQWTDVIIYWMTEYKFDGFRFDLVKGLGLNSSYSNASDNATNVYNASRVAQMRRLQEVVNGVNPDAIFINENLATAHEENEMAETGQMNWANINDPACQFAMGYSSDSNMNRLYAPDDDRTWGSTVSYLESHDEQRLAYKQNQWGVTGVKGNDQVSMWRCGAAAAQMIMAPGSHMIWMFSEMGNAQNTKTDIGNDVSPKIVNWNLLDNPNHYGLYQEYCDLISVRLANPDLFTQEASFSMNCDEKNWANGRTIYSVSADGNQELYTFINPNVSGSNLLFTKVPFLQSKSSAYKIYAKSTGSSPSFNASLGNVSVPPNCFVTIGSATLGEAGIEGIEADNEGEVLMVRGGTGELFIDYAANGASVYSLDGKVVGKVVESGSFNVAAGLYIVKSGKSTVKVIVR